MEIDFTPDRVGMTEPPLWAVEIERPTQSTEDLVDKARQMITTLTETSTPHTVTEGAVEDEATGITVELDAVFGTA